MVDLSFEAFGQNLEDLSGLPPVDVPPADAFAIEDEHEALTYPVFHHFEHNDVQVKNQ